MVKMIEFLERNDVTTCLVYKMNNAPETSIINDKYDKYENKGINKKTTVRQLIHDAGKYFALNVDSFYLIFNSYQTNSSLETKLSKELKLVEHDDRRLIEIGLVFGKGSVNRFLLYGIRSIKNKDVAMCVIRNVEDLKIYTLQVDKNETVSQFYYKVFQLCQIDDCNTDNLVLIFYDDDDDKFLKSHLNEDDTRLLCDIGVVYRHGVKNVFELFLNIKDYESSENHSYKSCLPLQNRRIQIESSKSNHLHEGPGLSSITKNLTSSPVPIISRTSTCIQDYHSTERTHIEYRGLVNQAMTCYLNSLLQGLFMTPEFRNALYYWKYNYSDINKEASKSITFQLQQLFLKLQTSPMNCIETLNLTHSFGWVSNEALRQQDLQELCRIMFEALEKELRNTTHFDLINKLYQGKMLDYVKCLECGYESSKVSTFLDLTLPIRPFGRTDAYQCLIEALNGYIQHETLEGNNQYECLNCNKKCNAHKGMKFIQFPYILTVHLMRFDYDYVSMNHIKLYDKVEFPQILNLNSFISDKSCLDNAEVINEIFPEELFGPCNRCDNNNCPEINISPAPCDENINKGVNFNQHKNKELGNSKTEPVGPYIYDLYAIMLHSGNATRGHYFAYIKDFKTNQWFCFNDQCVTKINMKDIEKSFGGIMSQEDPDSSASAYMLMYRLIDKNKNRNAISPAEFPPHVKDLQNVITMLDKYEKLQQETFKVPLTLTNCMGQKLQKMFFECNKTTTLEQLKKLALEHFKVTQSCKLAILDKKSNSFGFDMVNDMSHFIIEIIKSKPTCSFLLQLDDECIVTPGYILMKLFMINLDDTEENIDVNHLVEIEMEQNKKIEDLSDLLSIKYNISSETLFHFVILNKDSSKILLVNKIMECSSIYPNNVFVFIQPNFINQSTLMQKIISIVLRFHYTIQLQFVLPSNNTDLNLIPEDYWTNSSEDISSVNCNGENVDQSENNYLIDNERLTKEDIEMDTSEHEPKKIDDLKMLENNGLCVIGDISDSQTFMLSEKYSFKMMKPSFENNGTFDAFVDKRMNVKEIFKYLEPRINLTLDSVVYRVYKPGNILELTSKCTLIDLNNFDTIQISFDLLDDQYCASIYCKLPNNPGDLLTKVFYWVFTEGTSVLDTKVQLLAKLKETYNINIPLERFRIRKRIGNVLMKCYLNGDIWEENFGEEWDMVIYDLIDRSEYELDTSKQLIIVAFMEYNHGSKPTVKCELEFVVEKALTPAVNIQLARMISRTLNIPEDELELGCTKDLNFFFWESKSSNWSFDLFDDNICVTCRYRQKKKKRPFKFISNNNGENVK